MAVEPPRPTIEDVRSQIALLTSTIRDIKEANILLGHRLSEIEAVPGLFQVSWITGAQAACLTMTICGLTVAGVGALFLRRN